MDSLSTSNKQKTLHSHLHGPEKKSDPENAEAVKIHDTKPSMPAPGINYIDGAYRHLNTEISQRRTNVTSNLSLIADNSKSSLKTTDPFPLRCLSKAEERKLFLTLRKKNKSALLREQLSHKIKRQNVLINLIETADKHQKTEEYKKSLRIINQVLSNIKDNHDSFILSKAARVMAYTAGYCGDYIGALKYFDIYQKHADFINPADILFFSGLYLGLDFFQPQSHMTFPSFNLNRAREILFATMPNNISKTSAWNDFAKDYPESQPLIHGLVNLKNKEWDITEQLKKLNTHKGHNHFFRDFLCCIAIQELINNHKYDIAKKILEHIGDGIPPFLKKYCKALTLMKTGDSRGAFILFYQELINNKPVFKELSQLLIETGNLDGAVEVFRYAEEYFKEQAYPQEAAFYNLRADLLVRQIHEDQLKPEPEAAISTTLSDLQDEEPESASEDESQEASSTAIEADISSLPKENPEYTTVRPKIKKHPQATATRSEKSYYYEIRKMIEQFNHYSSDLKMQGITDKLHIAIKQYPEDLWLLHLAGWWHYECGNDQQSKKLQLKGLQIALGLPQPFPLPANAQNEKRVVRQVVSQLEQFANRGDKPAPLNFENKSRDIASFLSAYAHHLATDGLTNEASTYRNWADRLDTRRGKKGGQNLKLVAAKIRVLDQEAFDQIKNPVSMIVKA